jgi:hypothetical protein
VGWGSSSWAGWGSSSVFDLACLCVRFACSVFVYGKICTVVSSIVFRVAVA